MRRRGILQLPPVDGPAPKSFDIRKYKTAAVSCSCPFLCAVILIFHLSQTTLLKSGRTSELRRNNRALLACRLPPEILQEIFLYCAQTSFDTSTWSWVDLSYVCSTWRMAALDHRELWTYIDFSHPKWTALTLRRSQILPISVRASVNPKNQYTLLRTLQHAPMICDIHLIASIYDLGPLIKTLKTPNQCLESLVIVISPPDDNQEIRYSKRSTPSTGRPLPNLCYLELHRAPISFVSARYINLRHLSLHHLPFSERPARQDFLSLLERFTCLEHLTLTRAFPKNVAAGSCNAGRVIHLSNLLTVSLTGSVQELVNVLECLSLPPDGRIHCYVDRMGDFKTNFWKLAKVLGYHFHRNAWAMPLDTVAVTSREEGLRFTDEHGLNPDFRQTLRIRAFGVTEPTEPLLDLVLGPDAHSAHDEIIVSALTSVWEALPLMHIHTLSLQNLDVLTHKTWSRLLPSLTSIRVLDIGGHAPSGLLWALLLNARSHSHLEHDDMSFMFIPTLEDVYIHNVDCFTGGLMVSSSGPIHSHCDRDDSRFLDVVFAYLEDRRRCGLVLRSVAISCCENVSLDVVKEMQGLVSCLSWDHLGRYPLKKVGPPHLIKEEAAEPSVGYRDQWPSKPPALRHYYRLRILLQLDSS
ncbi:hypothetical protein DXG03_007974 [Asterophora parasitica]|uniref:F-box domain-containing protein n=1 Tax=Asterophora parasitica TaxID=117018 RepID=A0A9P7G8F1_9AGAR|nr:hypothetical protein DXG03_007974 [Asterophora parasitica]